MSRIRLHLGDCIDVLASRQPGYTCVIADPPYSRAGAAHTSTTNAAGKMASMSASDQFWGHWFRDQWKAIAAACADSACALIFTDYRTVGALERAIQAADTGWALTQCGVWDRGSIGLGSPMRAQHELIAFARGPAFKWAGRKDIANVFRCDWPYGTHEYHPAEKPVALLRTLLADFAGAGPVLDPFCGSASSGVAARALGLPWDGIESDHDTAIVAAKRLGHRVRLFADTVLRRHNDGSLWLMNRQRRGFGEYGIAVASEREVEVFYEVTVGEWISDEHGPLAPVTLDTTERRFGLLDNLDGAAS